MWNNWGQLRCVAHLPLILGFTIALLNQLGTCFVRLQSVRLNFACTNRVCYSLDRSEYQCLQCESMYQVRNVPFQGQTNSFSVKFGWGICNFEELQGSIQVIIGNVFCLGGFCPRQKCVYVYTGKKMMEVVLNVLNAKRAATFWTLLLGSKNRNYVVWQGWYVFFCRRLELWLRKRNIISMLKEFSPPITIKPTRKWAKKAKILRLMA